ncbi:hypothetical protein LZF95_21315 [Algoriphagus sp. AGSA1]|uniref:hypothetical protein n=1 Tax=Algoriphagus sp. AGSA1 TaxID=2907213 RepID=UPI001F1837CD|nr:hypothetical protein [Algoriphagus sp. AGSA1]MCE7057235.1 hypothetical protein [Algoriphagus sp. AGSA1]
MEEQIILDIINYFEGGVRIPVIISLVFLFLKILHPYYETFKNNYTKLKEIASNERIEKKKLKANRPKKKTT